MEHTHTSHQEHRSPKSFLKKLSKNKKALVAVAILAGFVGAFLFFSGDDPTAGIDSIVVARGNVVSEVSVTGRVEPSHSVDLAFEVGGKVESVLVDVGSRVYAGQTLARLGSGNEYAALLQAEARVKAEEAKLDELNRGSTPEAIAIKEVKVGNANATLLEEKRNLVLTLQDAYTKSDDAVRNKVDQFISNPEGTNPQINFTVSDPQLKTDIEIGRRNMTLLFGVWRPQAVSLTTESDLNTATADAKSDLDQTKHFLDNIAVAVNGLKASSNLTQTTIDGYRADVSTARTNVNTALTNVVAAEKKVRDAESALLLAQEELNEARAGTRPESIAAQEAKLEEARGSVLEKQATLAKTALVSPIAGVVTKQDAEAGEIVSANTVLMSVISDAAFEITTNIPEADIAKLAVGDSARVTLDAYGGDVPFPAHVTKIDPAETIIEGVATYTTTLHFDEADARIRSGMTANVDILADRRDDVVSVPARAVISRNGDRFVRILDENNTVAEVPVETGLRGSDGSVEIVSGVKEGDRVIVFIQE